MRTHLFSLHPSIWEIVESGMKFDSSDSPMFINEQIHRNAQATTVLLASLCRDEYHKVSGLDNAKQIWDTLKISHEGNDVTLLTKMELVEGELGRFAMIRGEEPTQTYNRLKTLISTPIKNVRRASTAPRAPAASSPARPLPIRCTRESIPYLPSLPPAGPAPPSSTSEDPARA
jgi:hypothetical protein